MILVYHEVHEDHEEFNNLIISTTGFQIPWLTKGKSYRFSPLWSNGPRLHGGNLIGKVSAASHGIIIKLFFVSFVLFVVIFLFDRELDNSPWIRLGDYRINGL